MEYRFDQIAYNSTEKKQPEDSDRAHYIGLEHLDSGCFGITRWGSDVTPTGEKLVMHKGDILFGKRRAYQRKVGIAPFDGIFSAHGMVLRPKENIIDKDYIPFFIASDQFMERAVRISVGGLSPTINWKDLKEQVFDIPTIDEQRKLAAKLWAAYRLKESYKKLLAATDEMVKSRFFSQFADLPFDHKWKDVVTIINGKAYGEEYKVSGTYPICGSGGIMGYGEKKMCDRDSIILGRKGNIDKPIYMSEDYWIVDTAFCLSPNTELIHPVYLYYWCKQFDFQKLNKQAVLPSLTRSDLEQIDIQVPEMAEQLAFVEIVHQVDKSKFELKQAIEKIDKVMRALMQ